MSEQICAIETGVILPENNVAALCIDALASRFLSGDIDIADVARAGSTVTEIHENGTHNACIACDLCKRRVDLGSLPGGMRISITPGSDAELPSTWLPRS